MKKETYLVTVQRPDQVSVSRMKNYIKAAIDNWCGQSPPDDPMLALPPVKVIRQKES